MPKMPLASIDAIEAIKFARGGRFEPEGRKARAAAR